MIKAGVVIRYTASRPVSLYGFVIRYDTVLLGRYEPRRRITTCVVLYILNLQSQLPHCLGIPVLIIHTQRVVSTRQGFE